MQRLLISIIIATKDSTRGKNIENLLNDIYSQDIGGEIEVCQVSGVSPIGKARNKGVESAKGDIFIFLDDDIRFGHQRVFKNLIQALISDKNIGICGASQLIPRNANWFQQRFAKEIAHAEHPVVKEIKEVGMVGSASCAVRRDVFFNVGKFNENLARGIDVEFCHRLKQNRYRVILVPETWIYHPPPQNLLKFMKLSFRNGKATAFADRYYPQLNFDVGTDNIIHSVERKSKKHRLWRYVKDIIKAIILVKPINLISRIVYAMGYFFEVASVTGKNA